MKHLAQLLLLALVPLFLSAQSLDDYTWRNVPIGSGGYISGMRFHPAAPHELYLRTDVGGAYRRDMEAERLVQLFNFGPEFQNYYAVAGITFDPSNPNSVIMAVDRRCSDTQSAILVSENRGEQWEVINVPFYFAANGGRDCSGNDSDKDREGNCLEVNPLNHNEIYIGSRDEGLWILDLEDPSHPVQIAAAHIPHNSDRKSIRSVSFHPVQEHLVFIAYAGYGVYMGNTLTGVWNEINTGEPGLLDVQDLSFSISGDILYAACKGEGVYKCSNPISTARSWSQIHTYTGNADGYLTVTASPHDELTVMTVQNNWSSLDDLQVSTNAGVSWVTKGANMTSIFPWKTNGFASNPSQIVFDPISPTKLYLSAFFGSYQTDDWTASDIEWNNEVNRGHEEVVNTEICAFPSNSAGNFLMLMDADHTGFIYDDISIDNFPTTEIRSSVNDGDDIIKGGTGTFCEENPDIIVACLPFSWNNNDAGIAYSNDGGISFTRSTTYDESWGKSVLAISASDQDRLVVANVNGIFYEDIAGAQGFQQAQSTSSVNGNCEAFSFTCLGPSGAIDDALINMSVFSSFRPLVADKVMGCVFYLYDQFTGTFHVSTDFGASWCLVNDQLPLIADPWALRTNLTAIPGQAGHLWLNLPNQLLRSVDGGQSWAELPAVQDATCFGFGKEKPGEDYAALYLFGKVNGDGSQRMYLSWDEGATWTAINDPSLFNIGNPRNVQGDRNEYGRVYLGSGGQGVFVGEAGAGCTADFDADGDVDIDDFLIFNTAFGIDCLNCAEDLNGDGFINSSDFLDFNSQFGSLCGP